MEEQKDSEKGAFYWFCLHSRERLLAISKRHRKLLIILGVLVALLLVIFRAVFHFIVFSCRQYTFVLLLILATFCVLRRCRKGESRVAKIGLVVLLPLLVLAPLWGPSVYSYLSLYARYQTLAQDELHVLPVTDFERIQPLNSVFSLAHDAVTESESPRAPDFVRVGSDYRWTMAIEPSYPLNRMMNGVEQLFSIPGTTSSPSFSKDNRVNVHFHTGEHLLFSRNSSNAVIRSFGVWRYMNYQPAEVIYIPDAEGNWIQVVSLIRWRGFFFPYPEFGGVQLIRQSDRTSGFLSYLKLLFRGEGEWIAPEKIANFDFLTGQNLVPELVSQYIADSFRFQNGFFAPFPGYHNGDIRIPDLEREVNPQPFVSYFRGIEPNKGQLYHYFALEPFDVEKQGLNTSVFVPADGGSKVFVYRHFNQTTSLSGVSSMATKVMESRKEYDWQRNRPVEHRPYIRDVGGKLRFFWLTTVVTARLGSEKGRFIAGSIPDLVITDAEYNTAVWVNPKDPSTWLDKVQTEMATEWGLVGK